MNTEDEVTDINLPQEEVEILEEYKIWKKHTPFWYDVLVTNGLEWPSWTISWLPTIDYPSNSAFSLQKWIIGTLTSNTEQDYLMIAKTRLPVNNTSKATSDVKDTVSNTNNLNPAIQTNKEAISSLTKFDNKIEIETKINHQGEVNRARAMPGKKYNIIATKTISGEVHIFDYFKHPTKPKDDQVKTEMRLFGHTQEGFGLSWNQSIPGILVSGANDGLCCVWDINSGNSSPIHTFNDQDSVCEDVCFHKHDGNIFLSCGDNKEIISYDLRQKSSTFRVTGHQAEVNSVEFNPVNDFIFISGSTDCSCALWDIRNMKLKLHGFEHHKSKVWGAKWNNKIPNWFASYSEDRRIFIWDLMKIGGNSMNEDNQNWPSELWVRLLFFDFFILLFSLHTGALLRGEWDRLELEWGLNVRERFSG